MPNVFIRKKWSLMLLLATLAIAIALTILPIVIQRIAVTWLEENGAERATIGDVDLNLFTGRLGVFDVVVEKDGEEPLRLWRLTADVDLWRLMSKRFFVKAVWLYEADLVIKQQEDGRLVIGGISLASESQAESEPQSDSEAPGFLDHWGVGIDAFAIRNSSIRYQSALLNERVDIKNFYALNVFSWQPEQPARINFVMFVNQQPITLSSDARVFRDSPDTRSTLEITDLDLSHYAPVVKQAGIDELTGIVSLSLAFDAVYETDKKAYINIDSDISLRDFRIRQGDLLVEHKRLNYQNQAKVILPAVPGEELGTTQGQLVVQDQTVAMADLRVNYANLAWNGNVVMTNSQSPDAQPQFKVKGNLEMADLQIDDEAAKLTLAMIKNISAQEIEVNTSNEARLGELVVNEINALQQTDPSKNPGLPEVALEQGVVKQVNFNNETKSAAVAGIHLTNLSSKTADNKLQLAQVQTIEIGKTELKLQESIAVDTLTINEARALTPLMTDDPTTVESMVQVSQTRLQNMQYQFDPQKLALQTIAIDGLNVLAKRQVDGSLYAVDTLANDSPPTGEGEVPSENQLQIDEGEPSTAFQFKVETVRIGNDSKIRIIDQSVSPNFTTTVMPLDISVDNIDSSNINSKTSVDINTSLNPGNQTTVSGWLTPFAKTRDADINLNIDALDLVMLSPYSVKAAGYRVRSGRINATLIGKINNDVLDAKTKLTAQRLNLDPTSDAARGKSAQNLGIGMPVDAALALMKDKKGNISVEIPVNGNLQDPDFAIGPAFRGALTQAIKKASVTYAAYALQPYGSILFGAQLLSKATALRLESVHFDPGEAEINKSANQYLEKIAGLMKERPAISITLCGTATDSDREVLRNRNVNKLEEALFQLAEQRGDTVKNHLMEQYSIAADRFFDCQPQITSAESAQPEVKLGL
jgi:outer membrane protein OmpA-like peptidoglycan-associated protein